MANEKISFKDWEKLDLRIAKILRVEPHPNADKLYLIDIDLGNEKRTLVAGLKQYYKPEELKGKQVVVFTNLEPATIRGIKSEGMVLAAVNKDKSKVNLLIPDKKIKEGSKIS